MTDNSLEYRAKFSEGLIRLIVETGMSEDKSKSFVLSGDFTDEMLSCIAMLSHGSEMTSSPTKTRTLCNELARKLQRRIAETQRVAAAGGLPFIQNVHPGVPN